MKDTLVLAYNGGSYGTYLEWVINSLTSADPIQEPFTTDGTSHRSTLGNHLKNMFGFKKYAANPDLCYATCRMHLKTLESEKMADNLDYILDHANRLILLYPDRAHELMSVCNYMSKPWRGRHHYDGPMAYINILDIFDNYSIDPNTNLKDIPTWIQREHMSFNLFSSWHDQVEWYFPDRWNNPRALIITTKDLFDNFETMVSSIIAFWDRRCVRSIDEMLPYHEKMLSLQKNIGKDQSCDLIIRSALGQAESITWDDIDLVSQAWIQYQLRERGYEIECQDLDEFPTDTKHLRSIIFKNV